MNDASTRCEVTKQPLATSGAADLLSPRLSPLRLLTAHACVRREVRLVRLGHVLHVSIVVTRLDVTLDALLALFRMLGVTLFGVDAARRRYLLDAGADTGAADANARRARHHRRRRHRRRRCRCLVVLLESQATQEALVNWLRRGFRFLAAR